jgi:hypothetical protein
MHLLSLYREEIQEKDHPTKTLKILFDDQDAEKSTDVAASANAYVV